MNALNRLQNAELDYLLGKNKMVLVFFQFVNLMQMGNQIVKMDHTEHIMDGLNIRVVA